MMGPDSLNLNIETKVIMDAKTLVWIRSGGRCAICNRYLLDNDYGAVVPVGENAHIVGQKTTAGSPRGTSPLPLEQRDEASNFILLCREQHRIVDNKEMVDLFTVEQLGNTKKVHEEHIRRVTGMKDDRKTTVVRMAGNVRGSTVAITRSMAAAATIASSGRYPHYARSAFGDGLELELRNLPNEGTPTYYDIAKEMVDLAIEKLDEAIRAEDVAHVSVFAFARIPMLIYLGQKLNDTYSIDVYQRHRASESWLWNPKAPIVHYDCTKICDVTINDEAALIVNVSGTIPITEVQKIVGNMPIYQIAPSEQVSPEEIPHPDSVANAATLKNFESTFRIFLAELERREIRVRRLHTFTAVPVSIAVTMGRVFNFDVDPSLVVYELVDGQRVPTMEVSK